MVFFLPELFVNLTSLCQPTKFFFGKKCKGNNIMPVLEMYLKEYELVTLFDVHSVVLWVLH